MIPLPDPPLRSGDLLLRPWRTGDAPSLVAAWADDEIRRWTAVPPQRDLVYAEQWISGWERRRTAELALDLVIDRAGDVVGEVGLSSFDRGSETVSIGWWVAAEHRGGGIATTTVALVAAWCRAALELTPRATVDPANPASEAVARHAGLCP